MTQSLASYFQHRAFVLKSLVLSLLVLGSFISGVGEVRAVTFGYDDGWGEKATFVANLNKTSYMPGEAITLSGSTYFEPACTNAIWGGTIYATLNGQTITAFNSLLNAFGYTYFSVVAFTAPTTPGTYMINVSGCISMCTSGNLWFTVLPANYGQSCASAGNACGQVSWGTIQANGACSVSAAPANPATLGWGCSSAPNSCGQTNSGTIQCNGLCSASTPSNASCPTGSNPIGYFDAANCTSAQGWTCDADAYSTSLSVHLYEGGTYLGATSANTTRADVSSSCGGTTAHGFSWTIPDSLKSGTNRTISAYAINVGGGTGNPMLSSSKTINCPAPAPIVYSCTGSIPANASMYGGDNTGLSANTAYTYSASDTGAKCQFTCDKDYAWDSGTAKCVAAPDLTATNISPAANAVRRNGTAITFTGNAVNSNVASITDGGWADIEFDWDNNGTVDYSQNAYGGVRLGAFTPSQTKPLSYTHNFNTTDTGTYHYRFHVDTDGTGVTESNESNNVSSWVSFSVIDGELTAPASVLDGGSANISWNTQGTGGLTCTVQGGADTWDGANGSGTSVPLTAATTYTLSCSGVILDTKTVAVTTNPPELTVNKRIVEQSTTVILTYDLNGQTNCSLTGGGLNQTVSSDGTQTVTVEGRTTYTLSCASGSDAVTVEVVPKGWES